MRPVIGVTCYSGTRGEPAIPYVGVNVAYVRAVERAGGAALLLAPQTRESLRALYDRLDGLLLTGGCDIAPERYGESRRPECQMPQPERDEMELLLVRWALDTALPLLGICRGIQLLNVALGGTLYQDLSSQLPDAARHAYGDAARTLRAHPIAITPGSRLAAILGTREHTVNSLHHQAVARIGDGAVVVARAPDGVIEGIEVSGHPFALAVQFHPEELEGADDPDVGSRRLFRALVDAGLACQRERM